MDFRRARRLRTVQVHYGTRRCSCTCGQDISSTQLRYSSFGDWPSLRILIYTETKGDPATMHLIFAKRICECPVCRSSAVRRSTRKGFVERTWFRIAFVWPYRCDDCDARFWGFHRYYEVSDRHAFEQAYRVNQPSRLADAWKAQFDRLSTWVRTPALARSPARISERRSSLS